MRKELDLLLPLLEDARSLEIDGIKFHLGNIDRCEIVAMECGIGKVNAACGTLTLIERFKPSLIINTGVAGGTGATSILDLVVASEVGYHDVWCGPGTIPGQPAGCPRVFKTSITPDIADKLGAKYGLIASGDIFISRKEEVEHIRELYSEALACDMESAAIAQVCYLRNVPFICVRVVSDTPGAGDNISQYENFWTDAPSRTFGALRQLLPLI